MDDLAQESTNERPGDDNSGFPNGLAATVKMSPLEAEVRMQASPPVPAQGDVSEEDERSPGASDMMENSGVTANAEAGVASRSATPSPGGPNERTMRDGEGVQNAIDGLGAQYADQE